MGREIEKTTFEELIVSTLHLILFGW